MTFMLLLVNNAVQKMRTRVTNTINLYKLTNALFLLICFKLVMKLIIFVNFYNLFRFFKKIFETSLKQINNKRTLVNLYKDIVLVTRVRVFCTALFTNYNIKVVIQIDTFLAHLYN